MIGTKTSARPLRRQLVKLACRILLGNGRAHYHSWLPSLSIAGRGEDEPGSVHFRGREIMRLQDVAALSARAQSRVFIIGSGPSIRDQDLAVLSDNTALLLNGAIALVGDAILRPLAVAIEDERFVWRHRDLIRDHIPIDTLLLLSPGVIRALCEIDADWLIKRPVIMIDDIRKPYGAPRRGQEVLDGLRFVIQDKATRSGFSMDPDAGVFQGGSVAISALQFALATDARNIGFVGVDISNANAPRFYETEDKQAYSGIAGAEARILAHVNIARKCADDRNVRLVNHSPVSALRDIGLDYRPLDQRDA